MPACKTTVDSSHHAFKCTPKIGPGPRKRSPVHQAKDWECQRGKSTSTHYVQICRFVGEPGHGVKRGAKRTIRLKKGWKTKYNKQYRAWAKRHPGRSGRRAGYRCRPTAVSKCR